MVKLKKWEEGNHNRKSALCVVLGEGCFSFTSSFWVTCVSAPLKRGGGFNMQTFIAYIQLMRINKPIGTLLLLWPTLWALWIASQGHPDIHVLGVMILGVYVMRAAGCVINDIADTRFDGAVKRTQMRPLVTGRVSQRGAWLLFASLLGIALLLVLTLNWLTIQLAVVGACLAALYPFMKRYTHWPQFFLGLAFSWGIPMAFAAQTNHVPAIAWQLYAATLFWVIAYDTLYAMVDRDDDLRIGIKSTAVLFGRYDKFWVALFHSIFLFWLALIGLQLQLQAVYYIALLLAGVLVGYQQGLIRHRDPTACFQAFLNNNWVGLVVFAGLLIHYV
jgi:4-hydroxybenzoate polyprenyltransferase